MEVLVGLGLASAAGLNAYLPLLVLGLLARFTDLVPLPQAWSWLSDPVCLAVLAVLLLVEVVADKVPGVDHLNDVLGAVVRPAAGGIAVGAGTASTNGDGEWWTVVLGAALALVVTVGKSAARAAVNATTIGTGAPVASTLEDGASLALTLSALLAPALVLVALVTLVLTVWLVARRLARRRPTISA
ncbi:protein of unknown function [Quadrisphaera granulorum]|uniref:Uncharacterized protein DUF4126 n=1 Tax=Quadrisphaera granulorum TaxID=317664 RepID=A0A315ZX96_9ACTN|nr:DUF4126 domain-containing protein [Quadrisphaera granulorum]PWJ49903.1 uncharacterized protein DUF4126 [Quadrisphaera granulorum]SZE98111.1 protein of unknown function [Quadrisphaera granulorum]